jgi:hypothetical protein
MYGTRPLQPDPTRFSPRWSPTLCVWESLDSSKPHCERATPRGLINASTLPKDFRNPSKLTAGGCD